MENKDSAYHLVISDLRKQRDEITAMIKKLESMSGKQSLSNEESQNKLDENSANPNKLDLYENPYLGMSIGDAARDFIERKRKPLGNADILAGIENGGVVLTGTNKLNTIGAVMNRRQTKQGDIVSVKRGVWGLKEWYPGRSFTKKEAEEKEPKDDPAQNYSGNVTPFDSPTGTEQH